ncbi:Uncharacterised protein [uncultured archaeon]|nr:Uncharacterised protein [uncultured archaeon]
MSARGQVSTEYTMLLSVMLMVLIVILFVMMGQFAQQAGVAQQRLAEHAVTVLAAGAQEMWISGPGAKMRVLVDLPQTFDSARSRINGSTIQLFLVGFGDVSRALPFNVSGYWPSKSGKFYAVLENNNTSIVIRPAGGMFVNTSSIYLSFAKGGSNSTIVQVINQANVSYTINSASITCPVNRTGADTTCTVTNAPTSPFAAGASTNMNIQIGSTEVGLRSGKYVISAAPTAGELIAEEIIIPITLRVDE